MAWTETDLSMTWHALAGQKPLGDWAVGTIGTAGDVKFEAGLRYPDQLEAIVITLPLAAAQSTRNMPNGVGFDVVPVSDFCNTKDQLSVALIRRTEGELAIFEIMAVDMLRQLALEADHPADIVWHAFRQRIEQWQKFMRNTEQKPLSTERQTGLFGELMTLEALTKTSLGAALAVSAWVGPRSAAQDFHIYDGAIEVKASISEPFIAKISSIEQLDCERSPVFLKAYKFTDSNNGTTLPDLVEKLRSIASGSNVSLEFDGLLLLSGYLDKHAKLYSRNFNVDSTRCFEVNEEFPHLKRTTVPSAVHKARYSLRVDGIESESLDQLSMFRQLGIESDGY